jgi:hypothetical protein
MSDFQKTQLQFLACSENEAALQTEMGAATTSTDAQTDRLHMNAHCAAKQTLTSNK